MVSQVSATFISRAFPPKAKRRRPMVAKTSSTFTNITRMVRGFGDLHSKPGTLPKIGRELSPFSPPNMAFCIFYHLPSTTSVTIFVEVTLHSSGQKMASSPSLPLPTLPFLVCITSNFRPLIALYIMVLGFWVFFWEGRGGGEEGGGGEGKRGYGEG